MSIVQQPLLHSVGIEAIFYFCDGEVVVEHFDAGLAEEEAPGEIGAKRGRVGVGPSFHVLLG